MSQETISIRRRAAPIPLPVSLAPVVWNQSSWRLRAACHNIESALFFPVGEGEEAKDQIRLAKQVCASCESRLPCLEFSLRTMQADGIWGGLTEDERRRLKRQRRVASRGRTS
jgi:WhiB family transcriptional regulator, redox-sensing transcriptional regulator